MTGSCVCRTIADSVELAAVVPEWWELWWQAPVATPFQAPAWLIPWWTNFAPGELCVVAIRLDGRLVGLAPFYCEHGHRGRRALPMGFPVTDYHDVLIAPQLEEPVLAALGSHLADAELCDEVEFTELPPHAYALRMATPVGYAANTGNASACPALVLPPTIAELQRTFPARKRRALRTAHNRAERRGPIEIVAANGDSNFDGFETLVALHRHRWNSRGEPGVLADSCVQRFHRDALSELSRAGLLRLYQLQIGGHTAAVYYGFHHRDQAYGYLTGFDPAYAFESPGVILLEHAIVEAAREGARTFHFLRGREPYKYEWGARDHWNKKRILYRIADKADDVA